MKLFCADPYTGWVPREKQQDKLRKIAARVEEVEQYAEGLEHDLEDARGWLVQWHDRAVMLPTDAEGIPFRVGDHVQVPGGLPDEGLPPVSGTIERMTLRKTGWLVRVFAEGKGRVFLPEYVRHAQAPTVEDVLQKMLEQAVGYSDANTTVALNTIAEYAAKLRLAGEE